MITYRPTSLADAIANSGIPLWRLAAQAGVDTRELLYVAELQRLPLTILVRVAQLIDFPVAKLFGAKSDEPADSDDACIVGACIGDHPKGLSRDGLARALRWNLQRVEVALANLDRRLSASGLRLSTDGDRIRIVGSPSRIKPEIRGALARSRPGNGYVDPDLGQAAWLITFRHTTEQCTPAALETMYRRKLVEYIGAQIHGSEAVRFSLILTEVPRGYR